MVKYGKIYIPVYPKPLHTYLKAFNVYTKPKPDCITCSIDI